MLNVIVSIGYPYDNSDNVCRIFTIKKKSSIECIAKNSWAKLACFLRIFAVMKINIEIIDMSIPRETSVSGIELRDSK